MTQGNKWKPGVSKWWLYFLSGVIWCGVGVMLMRWSWIWSTTSGWKQAWPFILTGLGVGVGTQYFFGVMAFKNIERIQKLPQKPCVFAFQSWWSYPLVVFMMGLGLIMKASPLPKTWLAGMYLAIGSGLFIAGLKNFTWRGFPQSEIE